MTELEDLKHSPIANISLASKELFHSNFLAWVFNTYPVTINAVLSIARLEPRASGECVEVTREERSLDLVARIGDDRLLVIENKLKSLPYKEQLSRYEIEAEKLDPSRDSCEFVLLTLSHLDCDGDDLPLDRWNHVDYGTLAASLLENMPRDADPYHLAIVGDYAKFVSALLRVAIDESKYVWSKAGSKLHGEDESAWLKKHKLHDLFGKRQGQRVAAMIRRRLIEKLGDRVQWQRSPRDTHPSQVSVYSGFSNSQPLVGIFLALSKLHCPVDGVPVGIGFQVQGDQFRSYVEWPKPGHLAQKPNNGVHPSKTAEIAWALFCDDHCPVSFWTPGRKSGPEDKKTVGGARKRRHKQQCRFGAAFQYRYRPLSEVTGTDVTLDNLADALIDHTESLLNDFGQIESLLQNHQSRFPE